jgi:acetyltransferase-like isoleucine patch superfamily enzyme
VPHLISPKARLGKNVRVWNFAYVGGETIIGDNTKIGSLAHVDYNVVIGKNCKVEGLAYIAPLSRIGDNVFIGPAAVLTNDPYPLSEKMIGVKVEDGAIICAGAVIKAGVTVGKNSVVGMGAVVTKDVSPDTVVIGVPAKQVYTRDQYEKKRLSWNEY